MKKVKLLFPLFLICSTIAAQEQKGDPKATEVWEPVPKLVTAGQGTAAPSDAIILFNGKNLEEWAHAATNGSAPWTVADGIVTVNPGKGDIKTKRKFTDFQLHIEWRAPEKVQSEGQGRGNSGIFLQENYELQVLDNYENKTYSNGQAGSIYKQIIPLANVCRKPGEWQTYDVIYTAPRFKDDGSVKSPARITAMHNGVLIQNNAEIQGKTLYIGNPSYEKHGPLGIQLQDHGNLVSYRNIWIRDL